MTLTKQNTAILVLLLTGLAIASGIWMKETNSSTDSKITEATPTRNGGRLNNAVIDERTPTLSKSGS